MNCLWNYCYIDRISRIFQNMLHVSTQLQNCPIRNCLEGTSGHTKKNSNPITGHLSSNCHSIFNIFTESIFESLFRFLSRRARTVLECLRLFVIIRLRDSTRMNIYVVNCAVHFSRLNRILRSFFDCCRCCVRGDEIPAAAAVRLSCSLARASPSPPPLVPAPPCSPSCRTLLGRARRGPAPRVARAPFSPRSSTLPSLLVSLMFS